jgi:hypothetical protein
MAHTMSLIESTRSREMSAIRARCSPRTASLESYLAQDRDLRQTRSDVVMQIRGDPQPHPLEFERPPDSVAVDQVAERQRTRKPVR